MRAKKRQNLRISYVNESESANAITIKSWELTLGVHTLSGKNMRSHSLMGLTNLTVY